MAGWWCVYNTGCVDLCDYNHGIGQLLTAMMLELLLSGSQIGLEDFVTFYYYCVGHGRPWLIGGDLTKKGFDPVKPCAQINHQECGLHRQKLGLFAGECTNIGGSLWQ